MNYPSDVTDAEWMLLEPLLNRTSKRGRKFGPDVRTVLNGVLYVIHTGCQWRYLPDSFGPWTRVWSQFRRWSRNNTWAALVAGLHEHAVRQDGQDTFPAVVIIDSPTHQAGARPPGPAEPVPPHSTGRSGQHVVAVDLAGRPMGGIVVATSLSVLQATESLLEHLVEVGVTARVEQVLLERSATPRGVAHLARRFQLPVHDPPGAGTHPDTASAARAWRTRNARDLLVRPAENTTESATGWLQVVCLVVLLGQSGPKEGRITLPG